MKLQQAFSALSVGALCALFMLVAGRSGAVDIYRVYALDDHGLGSRGRHIQSWSGTLAAAVGDVQLSGGIKRAAIWPQITDTDGGPMIELPTPNPLGDSSAASYARLEDGRYLIVGYSIAGSDMSMASMWINSALMPWQYSASALPMQPGSTGAEALDVAALPNGGAIAVGSDWPVRNGFVYWDASLWLISPGGGVQQRILPVPDGSGWSLAYSVSVWEQDPLVAVVVGRTQNELGGPWHACIWRVNLISQTVQFRYMDNPNNPTESFGYRADPDSQFAIGWDRTSEGDFGKLWRLRQGFPDVTLPFNSRLYGANSGGYLVGWQERTAGDRRGLVSHVKYLSNQQFDFLDLLENEGTFANYFHLLCNAEDGQITGCGLQSDYPGGPDKMRAIAGQPTGRHGADEIEVRRGQIANGDIQHTYAPDDESLVIRAQGGRVVVDSSFLSPPLGFLGGDLFLSLDIAGQEMTHGIVHAFDWASRMFVPTGMQFQANEDNPTHVLSWATFPSSWRSPSGEVRFRLQLATPVRRQVLGIDASIWVLNN